MIDLRKIGIIFVIAALTAIFITVTSEAIYPQPNYSDYCDPQPKADYQYDDKCYEELNKAQQQHDFVLFLSNSVLGVITIILGIYLPNNRDLNEWVGTGLLLGGLIAIFIGTGTYFHNLGRFIKPIVIFTELMLVIFLIYRKWKI